MARKSMPSWVTDAAQFWSAWGLRIAVLFSVGAHVSLVFLARTRRQQVSLGGTLFLWPAYQIADMAATYALGNLSLGGGGGTTTCTTATSSSPSCEQQVVAFWAPFLLLHLGLPDNISAYAFEDNTFSWRQAVEIPLKALGTSYVLYQYIYLADGGSGDLLPASAIMFVVGFAKYVERAVALWHGDLSNIRDSTNKMQRWPGNRVVALTASRVLDDEHALLLAQNMFHFCRRAMVDDSSIKEEEEDGSSSPPVSERIFRLKWSSMCKVVEMELSLMYDILYTKAAVIHTWVGYLIRLLSPLATAAATLLFFLFPKDCLKSTADVIITYILLAIAFLLDVVWLVRALGSTWAYAFLSARPRHWLNHTLLCRGWWRWFRHIVVSLDPSKLLLGQDPRTYRRWSGKIGRYNLLHECASSHGCMVRLYNWLLAKIGLEDSRYLSLLPPKVKELMFQRIRQRLPTHDGPRPPWKNPGDPYTMTDITTKWGQEAVKRRPEGTEGDPPFGREFQEDILVWHIATCIFLSACTDRQIIRQGDWDRYVEAIEVLSEYMMFLVAVRRHMLPGLVLRSLFEITRGALEEIQSNNNSKKKLAKILIEMKNDEEKLFWSEGNANKVLISDATGLGLLLFENKTLNTQEKLELIFDVWVDKLLYAGTLCSRESHARQLSRGGELTTIVWIMTEHAGTFRIGKFADWGKPEEKKKYEEQKPDEKPESPPRKRMFATLYPPR